jgi:uncharacterized protein (TIGR00266 family)
MLHDIRGSDGFAYLEFTLEPGESLAAEAGAMASMDADLDMTAHLNGGVIRGFLRKYLGGESLFINRFQNKADRPLKLVLTSTTPGSLREISLDGSSFNLEGGSYICSTPNVTLGLRYAGLSSFVGGEGLFKLVVSGQGTVWIGGYGALVEKHINGEFLVDSGHLVAYEPQIKLKTQLSGGLVGSFVGGEGLVTRLEGTGKVILQTRSLSGLAGWINPCF